MIILLLLITHLSVYSIDHRVLSYQEYQKIDHSVPYFFALTKAGQSLYYFGANHSFDPDNEQYPLLAHYWQEFIKKTDGNNCVVLVEGHLRNLYESKTTREAIRRGGSEGGFISFCAQKEGIPVECPEPSPTFLRSKLLEVFDQDIIDYRDFAHCIQTFQRRKQQEASLQFESFYTRFNDKPPLDYLIGVHKNIFDMPFDPNNEAFYYSITNPVKDVTIINKVCREASILRDQHIVAYIEKLLAQGKNIFVVYGATHAVMQEPALRKLCE